MRAYRGTDFAYGARRLQGEALRDDCHQLLLLAPPRGREGVKSHAPAAKSHTSGAKSHTETLQDLRVEA
eukprot:817711-Rhodomonas_salina.1